MDEQEKIVFDNSPLFQSLPPDKLTVLASIMETRNFSKGEVILREGDLGDEMYILLKGEVRISKNTLENEQYTIIILKDENHPTFGEFAMLDADRRSATITAIEGGSMLVLKRADFERYGNDHPAEGLGIMRQLAKRLSRELRSSNENAVLLFEALVDEVRAKEVG